ncbi:MAG: 30S ribosomal protein S13 [Candidatus Pacebacteria bacterium]|jgi:small subunit ribosomal protein S13|nr:30S ribosomal protein S13 [Candidatus Paceibacterota bacterium]
MRIAGITLPEKKQIAFALTAVYGVGRARALAILDEVKVPHTKQTKDITLDEENKIRTLVEKMTIEGDLRREVSSNIKRLKDIKAYRGVRHMKGLPTRGQRTKTNSRTVRGNVRKTMGSGRRKLEKT